MHRISLFVFNLIWVSSIAGQETASPNDVRDQRSDAYALVGATVQVDPQKRVENATLLIRQGRVVAVGQDDEVPPGYVVHDVGGRYIYPSFIDLDSGYGLPDPQPPAQFSFSQAEVLESQTKGAFNVNQAIRSEYAAATQFSADQEKAAKYRKLGFGAVLTHMADGIARGTGALVSLGQASDNELVLRPQASAHYSFSKGSSPQSYPVSAMGSIALLRQTFLDAQWYAAQSTKPFTDQSLEAWLAAQELPQIFTVRSWRGSLRADQVGDEFGVQYIIRGAGDEYRRIEALAATGAAMIVPLAFPEAQDVDDPWAAREIGLSDLKHWELAPTNPAALAAAGIEFALTSGADEKKFWGHLRAALKHGLAEADALAALTTTPASLLGMSDHLGQLKAGSLANFLITSKPLFDQGAVVQENWVGGQRFVLESHSGVQPGRYRLQVLSTVYELKVSGEPGKYKVVIPAAEGEKDIKVKFSFDNDRVTLSFVDSEGLGLVRLTGWVEEQSSWRGRGQVGDGAWSSWRATRAGDLMAEADSDDGKDEDENTAEEADDVALGAVIFPFAPYGWQQPPSQQTLLFQNATVWTLDDQGVQENTDVLVRDGRIAAVGSDLSAGSAQVIDASGMHITPGIVDEHSHIALNGVNDVATNSGMVRMSDVVDSEDVDIYRNLAGGVTAAQLLHGSANPIGGQSALVKFRWGALPREMLIEGADGFIKFALGENVKRSRNRDSIRYPGTRMGVEQVYRDAFGQARDYQARWERWNGLSRRQQARSQPPRRDLALETMVEILQGERFISCHSYRQSEINMLMHVAEDFDFRVNTFTHILEGYKVADKMAAHGAFASTFADWWAYKWEVRYAIPYGPALMTEAGVTVAVNSDSAEMSRRLNQEAAKSIKYGDMEAVEALKLVTLNPATMLHLNDRMGSIEVGKDADLVLWTDHPLSIYAIVDKTLVDGVVYFDREADLAMRESIAAERARLIAKMRKAKKPGAARPNGKPRPEWHCESLHGYERFTDRISAY